MKGHRASSVAGMELDSVEVVVEKRTQSRILAIINVSQALHSAITEQRNIFIYRLLSQGCCIHFCSQSNQTVQLLGQKGMGTGGCLMLLGSDYDYMQSIIGQFKFLQKLDYSPCPRLHAVQTGELSKA